MDIEAGTRRKKLMTEPTLPIYLKVKPIETTTRKYTPCMLQQKASIVSLSL